MTERHPPRLNFELSTIRNPTAPGGQEGIRKIAETFHILGDSEDGLLSEHPTDFVGTSRSPARG